MKRREFLKNIELIGIGCVAGGFFAPVVTSCGGGSASAIQVKLPDLPFKYVELDPDEVASAAYGDITQTKKLAMVFYTVVLTEHSMPLSPFLPGK